MAQCGSEVRINYINNLQKRFDDKETKIYFSCMGIVCDVLHDLELLGAPLAWLWLFIAVQVLVVPALVRGLVRRGSGKRYERNFWVQRAPQIAIATSLALAVVGFEAIELRLGARVDAGHRRDAAELLVAEGVGGAGVG